MAAVHPHPVSPPHVEGSRPQFAAVLGLLPPYSLEDVKRAYLDKVKLAHPDRGGDRADFDVIQRAYEQATEYLNFRSDRRQWIAARMDQYVAVAALAERFRELGAEVDTAMHDWVRRSFGDFADLTESIVGVRLADSPRAEELIEVLVAAQASLPGLKSLSLTGCAVGDSSALRLGGLKSLVELDLSHTQISQRALALVDELPLLTVFKVEGTGVGLWARYRLARRLARREQRAAASAVLHPVNIR